MGPRITKTKIVPAFEVDHGVVDAHFILGFGELHWHLPILTLTSGQSPIKAIGTDGAVEPTGARQPRFHPLAVQNLQT